MQLKILGSAAGGGFPQWNCACSNCARLRANTFHGTPRTQAQLAIRESAKPWCLINASPDLRSQILSDPDLAPQSAPRHSPIAAVVLTGADVDQVIGLLHLREFHPYQIYSTPAVETVLRGENSLFNSLQQTQPQADWKSITPGKPSSLKSSEGAEGLHESEIAALRPLPHWRLFAPHLLALLTQNLHRLIRDFGREIKRRAEADCALARLQHQQSSLVQRLP